MCIRDSDCTPDVSRKEQMTIVVRFVHAMSGKEVIVREHFLGFVQASETSGEGLAADVYKRQH